MPTSTTEQKALTQLDLRKQFKALYNPSAKEVTIVDVPAMQFLMVDGTGDPNTTQAYTDAIEALYGVAYTLKFLIKKEKAVDYPVMALEGLWWAPDMRAFSSNNKESWLWTMMMMQPEVVTRELFEQVLEQVEKKKPSPALAKMRLGGFHEGLSAQIMHIGPFSAEGPTIAKLHAFIKEHGYSFEGTEQKHHEIYLSDPRRTAPEKLRTVIRQPMIRLP